MVLAAAAQELSGVAGWMISVIEVLGAAGVGLIVFVETVIPPIPSEVVLPAAGYLSGTGELSMVATLVWTTAGSVLGALLMYWLGAAVGVERAKAWAERVPLMSGTDIDRAVDVFESYDRPAVFFGRLLPGVRSLVSIPAGVERMPLVLFTALTTAGSLLWNAVLIGGGYWLGDTYSQAAEISGWLNTLLLGAVAVAVVWFVVKRIRARQAS